MAGDPYFNSVSLLLHMDGADGSTTFTDSSNNTASVTANGSAQIKTAQSKFGGASGYFGTSGSNYLEAQDSPIFRMEDEDFTIEGWFIPLATGNDRFFYVQGVNTTGGLALSVGKSGVIFRANEQTNLIYNTTISDSVFTHVAFVREGTTRRIFIGGTLVASDTLSFNNNDQTTLHVGASNKLASDSFKFYGYIDDFRITKGVARYTSNFSIPTSAFPDFLQILAYSSAAGPLGAPSLQGLIEPRALVLDSGPLGQPQFLAQQWAAISSAPSMLGDVAALGWQLFAHASAPSMLGDVAALGWQLFARASAPSMLGAASPLAVHDFTGQLGDVITYYVMDLSTPGGTVRTPISSWQATLQTGASNYVQCVVPAVLPYVDSINVATEFVVSRRVVLPGDLVIEYEMARAPVQTVSLDQGPSRYTATISGYSTGFAPDEDPSAAYNRTLQDIRSVSVSTGGARVRCSIDWLLRPSHRVYAGSRNFVASYINYYVGNNDAYMDVGERA